MAIKKADIDPDKPLTPKQKKFADLILLGKSNVDASIGAGYSKRTAKSMATENLTKPNIKKYLQIRQDKLQKQVEISQKEWVKELIDMYRSSVGDVYYMEGGELIMRDEIPNSVMKNIKKVTQTKTVKTTPEGYQTETTRTAVEMYSRHDVGRTLGQALGFLQDSKPKDEDEQRAINFFQQVNNYITKE